METFEDRIYQFQDDEGEPDYGLMFDTIGKAARCGDWDTVVGLCGCLKEIVKIDLKLILRRKLP